MAALRFVNVSEEAINAMTVNSISESTKVLLSLADHFSIKDVKLLLTKLYKTC